MRSVWLFPHENKSLGCLLDSRNREKTVPFQGQIKHALCRMIKSTNYDLHYRCISRPPTLPNVSQNGRNTIISMLTLSRLLLTRMA